jgi:intracellular multiplication protein IcmX
MKKVAGLSLSLVTILSFSTAQVFADDTSTTTIGSSSDCDTCSSISSLGAYLGYDISTTISAAASIYGSPGTFDASSILALFGALPVNQYGVSTQSSSSSSVVLSNFLPTTANAINSTSISTFNNLANTTFYDSSLSISYQTPGSTSYASVIDYIDSIPYQQDPTSQMLINFFSTPDISFCNNQTDMDSSGRPPWDPNYVAPSGATTEYCQSMQETLTGLLGDTLNAPTISNSPSTVPSCQLPQYPFSLYSDGASQTATSGSSSTYPPAYIAYLNVNTLLSPLMYSTSTAQNSSSSCGSNPMLPSGNQALDAYDFIRYILTPLLPSFGNSGVTYSSYQQAWNSVYNPTSGTSPSTSALNSLLEFNASVRSYAALSSLVASNINFLYAERVPQTIQPTTASSTTTSSSQVQTSKALSDFQMATWRLYDSASSASTSTSWLDNINAATTSAATVTKEIAVLLAEINYQLYQSRMLQERMLLTETLNFASTLSSIKPTMSTATSTTSSSS